MPQQGVLTGIRVLDLSRMLPGPYCSMILGDHGAQVIAIEDKKFQSDGLFFSDLNRNKRHLSLNLKSPQGMEVFFRLVEKADVILEGFRPGVVERLGVDYQTVRQKNPRIIYCSISGFGQTGPARLRAGHDVNYLSASGVLSLIGEKHRPPAIPGVQVADIAGGGLNAVIGILLALLARERTGEGQYIDISMTDGMVGFLSLPYYFARQNGQPPQQGDALLSHRYACYNTYETADGRYLALGAVENKFWRGLCDHLQCPEYIALQYDETRRQEIIDFLRQTFLGKTLAAWEAELAGLDICCTVVRTMDEVLTNELFQEREMVYSYTDANGAERHGFGIPVKLSRTPGSIRTMPTAFGAATREILAEAGYTDDQIAAMVAGGVV
ncbi:MAG: CoA transferase [Desulforhopalus sp.]|nr:CoA transferase [Desulforhopalus sp.]